LHLSRMFVYLCIILFIENMANTDIMIDGTSLQTGVRPMHVGWRICIHLQILHLLAIPEGLAI
jgi:hypothetical protein